MRISFSIAFVFFLFACGPKQIAEYTSSNQKLDSTFQGNGLDSIIAPYRLNLEKEISRDLFSDYKFFQANGKTLEHSYGYQTIKQGNMKGIQGEEILELKMYEYSTVALGMNPETSLLSIKSFEDSSVEELEQYLRKYDVSNTKGKQIESIIQQIKSLSQPESTDKIEPSLTLTIKQVNEMLKTTKLY